MNEPNARWWIAALAGLILVLIVALVASQTEVAEGAAGLLGLVLLGIGLVALLLITAAVWPKYSWLWHVKSRKIIPSRIPPSCWP